MLWVTVSRHHVSDDTVNIPGLTRNPEKATEYRLSPAWHRGRRASPSVEHPWEMKGKAFASFVRGREGLDEG
jgi:hypothetical protein